jgi:hypothetical protein
MDSKELDKHGAFLIDYGKKHGIPMACDMYMDDCLGILTKRRNG